MRLPKIPTTLLFLISVVAVAPNVARAQYGVRDVSVGTVLLNRDTSYDNGFVHDGVGGVLIGESQFDNGVEAGFNIEGNFDLDSRTGINTRFFVVDDWSESATATTGGGAYVAGSAVAGDALYTDVFSSYSSSLYSAEVSLSRQHNEWLTFLGGFRWLMIDESSHTDFFTGVVDSADYEGSVENNLYGGQFGIDTSFVKNNRGGINGVFKAGIYGVDLQNTGLYENGITAPLSDSDSDVAFVGEIDLNCNIRLTDNIFVSSGWMFLWVDGIGVLSEQYDNVNWVTGNGTDIDGHAFYHGAVLNVTLLMP